MVILVMVGVIAAVVIMQQVKKMRKAGWTAPGASTTGTQTDPTAGIPQEGVEIDMMTGQRVA